MCVFWCACLSINVLIFLEHENIQRQLAMDQHKSTSILSYSTYINDPFTTHPTTALNKSGPVSGLVIGCLSELHPGQIVLDSSTCLTDLLQHSSTEMERYFFRLNWFYLVNPAIDLIAHPV